MRLKIAELYQNERDPEALARGIAALGNAENESWGIEFGYRYDGVERDPVRLRADHGARRAPAQHLPARRLRALRPARPWFTLLRFGDADPVAADRCRARRRSRRWSSTMPALAPIYEAKLVLVRPDTHVAWRGNECDGRRQRGGVCWERKVLRHAEQGHGRDHAPGCDEDRSHRRRHRRALRRAACCRPASTSTSTSRRREFGEIGAGIQISPNASRLLHPARPQGRRWMRAGVRPARRASAALGRRPHPAARAARAGGRGGVRRAVLSFPSRRSRRRCWPRRCRAERAHAGHRLVGIEQKGERVIARFENGASVEADVLVGADGIHSRVRELTVRPREAALHRLRRMARAGAGRAHRASRHRSRPRTTGWGRAGTACTTGCRRRRLMNVVCIVEHGDWTAEVVDRQGRCRRRAGALRGLASDRARPDRRVPRDLHLGAARPRAAAALDATAASRCWAMPAIPCCR